MKKEIIEEELNENSLKMINDMKEENEKRKDN